MTSLLLAALLPLADDPTKPMKEVAGTAEFLQMLPKPLATLVALDPKAHTVTLTLDGEKSPKVWPVEPDAEIKVAGWWGRLEQFRPHQTVWVWLKLDRKKKPVSVAMLADVPSREDIHAVSRRPASARAFERSRAEQRAWLRQQWTSGGLPGTLTFTHVFSGELELTLDHEAMRWARSLQAEDVTRLAADAPIKAVVKSVRPWRERTVVRLVADPLELSDLKIGQRIHLKMTPPAEAIDDSLYPPDLDRPRSAAERMEWLLASIYCPCGVGGDICTGHFYTLASCNPNACGMPHAVRGDLEKWISRGWTDRQIFDALVKEHGAVVLRPHLGH